MASSLISTRAEADVADLFSYQLDYSDASANRLVDDVIAAVRRLERFPESAPVHPLLGGGIRALQLNRWRATLYYVIVEGEGETVVSVLRVLRQERDVTEEDFEGAGQ